MRGEEQIWADPRLIYTVAVAAVTLLAATVWLFRRRKKTGRGAGMICLVLSIILHVALICLVPLIAKPNGGSATVDPDQDVGVDEIMLSTFDPDLEFEDASGTDSVAALAPLPVAELTDLLAEDAMESSSSPQDPAAVDVETQDSEFSDDRPDPSSDPLASSVPKSLQFAPSDPAKEENSDQGQADLGDALDDLLLAHVENESAHSLLAATLPIGSSGSESLAEHESGAQDARDDQAGSVDDRDTADDRDRKQLPAPEALVPKSLEADFANRTGAAKQLALHQTGGSMETEAAVENALRFLVDSQREDGAWDPRSTGAGVERRPLGEYRRRAGTKAETGLTGLALLTLMGAGHTHRSGEYADNVFRGLAFLISRQKPDGSLAGDATVYSASYCHGMAALAMCEAAAVTGDPSAIESARRALAHSVRTQHPVTGGWRYTPGDPGDLSQLGWQAMVFDAGSRAGIAIERRNVAGVERFLQSVRAGRGGLASYRPGEKPSRTMTAEALATRLLIGQIVPQNEIDEASRYILQDLPGRGVDNYYYWYYATLALHQLQDESWQRWNSALQSRLLSSQHSNGSWPTKSLWAGYGGTVYSTSMATLCLESYYRHAIRKNQNRISRSQLQPVNR